MQRFSLERLHGGQEDVIRALLNGRRVLYVAPTGHGKSLCYQALAADTRRQGVVLVFSPLKALMNEQVERARQSKLRAATIHSDIPGPERDDTFAAAKVGMLDLLFVAPERLGTDSWLEHVQDIEIKGVVVDEAHCISQWGHDFRPWYRRLVRAIQSLGLRTPVLATTATAPAAVVDDIREQIAPDGRDVLAIRIPSYRPEIGFQVVTAADSTEQLARMVAVAAARPGRPGIVYVLTRKSTEIAAHCLRHAGITAETYFGSMDAEERTERLARWSAGEIQVLCATSALGMGLDRRDLRWVVHLGLPTSLLEYVQQVGRVGRDGESAEALAIVCPEDQAAQRAHIISGCPPIEEYKDVEAILAAGEDDETFTRTQIVEKLDLPESHVRRILDDLLDAGCVERFTGNPWQYQWAWGVERPEDVPDPDAQEHRRQLFAECEAYPQLDTCRARALASAMGDERPPIGCGRCDRCRPCELGRPDTELVRAALACLHPPLKFAGKPGNLQKGVALAYYNFGLGVSVARAKRAKSPMPQDVRQSALSVVRSHPCYKEVAFDAVAYMPPTESPDHVVGDCARWLGQKLGCRTILLQKVRKTSPQKALRSRPRKRENVEGAFAWPQVPSARRVLLVDDVFDTGQSILAAAKALPSKVFPLTFARTVSPDDP
ncbi:RecQ family ATP-dependent DNA helicase [Nannocystis sp. RBIL2]|uniref:RecQ family ATP-dependent DNA helicase n=1 Tax=Nannocystis sp. RBIL2 TaxID=2996788 RepID=UPI00226D79EF|nr:RecQ family ATP-dependent DNA helicase [Nannocystis sp. RBIL2]MCY1065605.1 RecQ family ATP-dependent DNA helicase [Nannocystis sp. RBIL2]